MVGPITPPGPGRGFLPKGPIACKSETLYMIYKDITLVVIGQLKNSARRIGNDDLIVYYNYYKIFSVNVALLQTIIATIMCRNI